MNNDIKILLNQIDSLKSQLSESESKKDFLQKEVERLSRPTNLRLSGLTKFLTELYVQSNDAELRSRLASWLKNL